MVCACLLQCPLKLILSCRAFFLGSSDRNSRENNNIQKIESQRIIPIKNEMHYQSCLPADFVRKKKYLIRLGDMGLVLLIWYYNLVNIKAFFSFGFYICVFRIVPISNCLNTIVLVKIICSSIRLKYFQYMLLANAMDK